MAIVRSGSDNWRSALNCKWESREGSTIFKELINEMPRE